MKQKLSFLLTAMIAVFLFIACSKSDVSKPNPGGGNGNPTDTIPDGDGDGDEDPPYEGEDVTGATETASYEEFVRLTKSLYETHQGEKDTTFVFYALDSVRLAGETRKPMNFSTTGYQYWLLNNYKEKNFSFYTSDDTDDRKAREVLLLFVPAAGLGSLGTDWTVIRKDGKDVYKADIILRTGAGSYLFKGVNCIYAVNSANGYTADSPPAYISLNNQ